MPYTLHEEYSDLLDSTLKKALQDCKYATNPVKDWNKKVKKVVVLLSASRGGSSLLKEVLASSPDVVSLPGEEEPYYILTKNVYPFGSDSDYIGQLKNTEDILSLMWHDLGVKVNNEPVDMLQLAFNWYRRLLFQFPERRFEYKHIYRAALRHYKADTGYMYTEDNTVNFIKDIIGDDAGLYDIVKDNVPFTQQFKIEEPPFVVPGNRRRVTYHDLESKTFLFKTPQDYCRSGIFEQLFPNAEIQYIHLTRGYAQSVNGLMDGWLSDTGFFSYNVGMHGTKLDIKGYSDVHPMGRDWWNFDLFPGWKDYIDKPLQEVCAAQWKMAHQWISNTYPSDIYKVKFEDFLADKQSTLDDICNTIGISRWRLNELPNVMSTDKPKVKRWHKRKDLMLSMQHDTSSVMTMLDYSTDTETWI